MPDTKHRLFVVVSGPPGSGKSTLGRLLAARLGLPALDKDDILERLFDSKGTGDAAWRRTLSRESDALFQSEAAASQGAVLVSFWHLHGMPSDSGTPTGWLAALSDPVVHVRCVCPLELAAARFLNRRRHAGHLDAASTDAEIFARLRAEAALDPLDLEPVVAVDTSGEVDLDALIAEIEAAFRRSRPQRLGAQ